MVYLAEVVAQKIIFDKKIKEVKRMLQYEQTEKLAQELFALLELRQSKILNIEVANNVSKISLGGTEVTISTAIIIRDTIKEKIDVLTTLINNKDCGLDKVELQGQRDKYYDEYVLLTMGVTRNDLQVKVE